MVAKAFWWEASGSWESIYFVWCGSYSIRYFNPSQMYFVWKVCACIFWFYRDTLFYLYCMHKKAWITSVWYGEWVEVSIPTFGQVSTSSVCIGCLNEVVGCRFVLNLICLPLEILDVTLRMDWLIANHIRIDYGKWNVVFLDAVSFEMVEMPKRGRVNWLVKK